MPLKSTEKIGDPSSLCKLRRTGGENRKGELGMRNAEFKKKMGRPGDPSSLCKLRRTGEGGSEGGIGNAEIRSRKLEIKGGGEIRNWEFGMRKSEDGKKRRWGDGEITLRFVSYAGQAGGWKAGKKEVGKMGR